MRKNEELFYELIENDKQIQTVVKNINALNSNYVQAVKIKVIIETANFAEKGDVEAFKVDIKTITEYLEQAKENLLKERDNKIKNLNL